MRFDVHVLHIDAYKFLCISSPFVKELETWKQENMLQ